MRQRSVCVAVIRLSTLLSGRPDASSLTVGHIYNTLARSAFNADDLTTYQAVAHTVRDKLLSMWNASQTYQTMAQKKKVWYLSFEFLQGRALDNAIINLRAKPEFSEAIKELGFNMEDLIDCERDGRLS